MRTIDVDARTTEIVSRLRDTAERYSWLDEDGREMYEARKIAEALKLDYKKALTYDLPESWKRKRFVYISGFRSVVLLYITHEAVELWATMAPGVRNAEVRRALSERLAAVAAK